MKAKDFLTPGQQKAITEAIGKAELDTSGEIRIHIEDECSGTPMERAASVFGYLGMDKTGQRNGVLIYLACQSKVFAIVGDKGINDAVPKNFWKDVSDMMSDRFRHGDFAGGLETAATMVGEKLKEYFPYREDDVNEQPDDLSFGDGDAAGRESR